LGAGRLAPDSDAVIYQDRVIHVASWANDFFFGGKSEPAGLAGFPGVTGRVLIDN